MSSRQNRRLINAYYYYYRYYHYYYIRAAVYISSVQSLDRGGGGGLTWGTIEQMSSSSFVLQEVLVSSSSMGRDVLSLVLSILRFLCRTRRRPASKVPWRMVLERLLWRVACPYHVRFRLLTDAGRGSCGPTRKLIVLRTTSLVLCSK